MVSAVKAPVSKQFGMIIPYSDREANQTLEQRIQDAREQARFITEIKGVESHDAAVAWDIVEELLSEAAHQRIKKPQNNFDRYCQEHPDAVEAKIYDV